MERVLDLELEALYHVLTFDLKYGFLICKMGIIITYLMGLL